MDADKGTQHSGTSPSVLPGGAPTPAGTTPAQGKVTQFPTTGAVQIRATEVVQMYDGGLVSNCMTGVVHMYDGICDVHDGVVQMYDVVVHVTVV